MVVGLRPVLHMRVSARYSSLLRPPEWTRRERLSYVFASYSFSLTFSSLYCVYYCSLVPRGSIDIIFKSYNFLSAF